MGFVDAVKSYFIKWNDFNSRSSRSEYWWATLFVSFASYIFGFAIGFLVAFTFNLLGVDQGVTATITGILILILQVFMIIAGTALVVRRLHDINRSGWWYLLLFTVVGLLILLYWFCTKGDINENRFGNNPLQI